MSEEIRAVLDDGAADASLMMGHAAEIEESPTVLTTDRWTKRTGERLAAEWAEVGVEGVTSEDVNLAADAIETLLSSQPTLHARPSDPKRAGWWKGLMESPETAALRARTVFNPAIAEIAAASLASKYAAYAAETADDPPPPTDGDESPRESMKRIRSIREALKEADSAAEDAESISAGLGMKTDSSADARSIASFSRRLRGQSRLLNIMKMAGRFAMKTQQLQRQRTDLPGMEITGIELSGDVSRLLPYENALVAGAVPELELLAMARLAQRRSLSYRRVLREPVGMGPIVVCVDESGSMSGTKVEAAKGLALAMASIARAQKRPFMLCGYSDDSTIRVAEPTPEGIVAWCEAFLSGGSDLDMPLASVRPHWPKGKVGARADHIIISDAEITAATPQYLGEYMAWAKQGNVRTYSIIIGHSRPGPFKVVSDGGCWCIPQLDLDNPAIESVLSIGPTSSEIR